MGLFSSLKEKNNIDDIKMTADEAYLAILWSACYADGELDDEEVQHLVAAFTNHHSLKYENIRNNAFNKFATLLKQFSLQEIQQIAVRYIESKHAEAVFINYVSIIFADGFISTAEEEQAEHLQEGLGLDKGKAKQIIQFVLAKNSDFT